LSITEGKERKGKGKKYKKMEILFYKKMLGRNTRVEYTTKLSQFCGLKVGAG
jgi:hypothetical protein